MLKKKNAITKLKKADITRRSIAYIIDLVLMALPVGIIFAPRDITGDIAAQKFPDPKIALPVTAALFFAYFFLCIYFNKGQSLGNMIAKIRVISYAGSDKNNHIKPNIKQSAFHSIGKIYFVLLLDILIGKILYRGEDEIQNPTRFFQKLAGTLVVED